MAGLSENGFEIKTLDEILADIEASLQSELGPEVGLDTDTLLGQVAGVFGGELAELWELAQAVHVSQNPNTSSGTMLEDAAALTGDIKRSATKSEVNVTCSGDASTLLAAGRVLSVNGASGIRFASVADATIGAGGTVDVLFESEETGPVIANAGTLTVIETPIAGWVSAANAADAELGTNQETDPEFRARREAEMGSSGAGLVDAIRSSLLEVPDVIDAFVFNNWTDVVDANGLPPHSVEALVLGGADADIRQALWVSGAAAGIATHGSVSGTVTDSQGFDQTIKYSRPTDKSVHIAIDITTDEDFPADGEAQVKTAIALFGDSLGGGKNVITAKFNGPAFSVPGVVDVTEILIGFSDPPTLSDNLAINLREISTFDTANIDVNIS